MTSGLPEHLRALLHPRAYPHPVEKVEVVETHISWILLTGAFAYKIKRPVNHSFVDLRSMEHRAFLCHEELRLNRRFAPEIYLDVCTITTQNGEARVAGSGKLIEHAVKMQQFPRNDELDRLLSAMQVAPQELEVFGRDMAAIHVELPVAWPAQKWGRPEYVRAIVLENLEQCAHVAGVYGREGEVHSLRKPLQVSLETATPCMSERFAVGKVRECHGDLHSRNVVRYGSRLLAFDCLEFAPALRWIDVADEVAFLLSDLDAHQRPRHAQAFLAGYLTESWDYQSCQLLSLYKAHRALVRAKVTALVASDGSEPATPGKKTGLQQFDTYLEVARRALAPKTPKLILMSGLSGSGKTWIASLLAPQLEAVHLRSDVERKRLAGMSERGRSKSGVAQGLYSPEASARVYEYLRQCAREVLAGGYPVIVDATFQRKGDRAHFAALAIQLGVPAYIVYCQAPPGILEARITQRNRRNDDASEADISVLRRQEIDFEAVHPTEPFIVINSTAADPEAPIRALESGVSN